MINAKITKLAKCVVIDQVITFSHILLHFLYTLYIYLFIISMVIHEQLATSHNYTVTNLK